MTDPVTAVPERETPSRLPAAVMASLRALRKASFEYGQRSAKRSDDANGPDAAGEFRAAVDAVSEALTAPAPAAAVARPSLEEAARLVEGLEAMAWAAGSATERGASQEICGIDRDANHTRTALLTTIAALAAPATQQPAPQIEVKKALDRYQQKCIAWGSSQFDDYGLVEQARAEVDAAIAQQLAPVPGDLAEALELILPLAKAYAGTHLVGSNRQYVEQAEAALAGRIATAGRAVVEGPRWRHVKRGTEYVEIAQAEVQKGDNCIIKEGDVMVVYRDANGKAWTRTDHEFQDGRFVRVDAALSPEPAPEALDDEVQEAANSLSDQHFAPLGRQAHLDAMEPQASTDVVRDAVQKLLVTWERSPDLPEELEHALARVEDAWLATPSAGSPDVVPGLERAIELIQGGYFLHDAAPPKLFADEVCGLLRATINAAKLRNGLVPEQEEKV